MNRFQRVALMGLYLTLFFWAVSGIALADPLDDAAAKLGSFLQRAGGIITGLIPAASAVAVGGLAMKRAVAKTMGEEETMTRTSNHITEVLKLTAAGMSAGLIVAIAGSLLK